ncbi:MAG: hypothetical protein HY703_13285 [Gemmatimonadetes bacterium]|nr:hypothetical protein [Gemmatimonadota bacterium]
MRHPSLYNVGGNGLIAGGILLAIGVFLHPAPPESADAAVTFDMAGLNVAHWAIALGEILALAGILCLSRHFSSTAAGGWALLGVALALVGTMGVITAPGTEASAIRLMAVAGMEESANVMADAHTQAVTTSIVAHWLAVVVFGLAMTRDSAWPSWLAYSGVGVGLLEVIGTFAFPPATGMMVALLGFAWLVAAGATMARMGRVAAAAPAGAAVGAGA